MHRTVPRGGATITGHHVPGGIIPYSDPKPISTLPIGLSQNAGFDNMVRPLTPQTAKKRTIRSA